VCHVTTIVHWLTLTVDRRLQTAVLGGFCRAECTSCSCSALLVTAVKTGRTTTVLCFCTECEGIDCWESDKDLSEKDTGNFKGRSRMDSCPLKIEPKGCAETSVKTYYYSLRNKPEERNIHVPRCESLKSLTRTLLSALQLPPAR